MSSGATASGGRGGEVGDGGGDLLGGDQASGGLAAVEGGAFGGRVGGGVIVVRAKNQAGYTTLEAVKVEGPAGADVQTLLWGPLPTSINQTIGQAVGVVRDDQFAIGLRPLTDRTEGAWPQEYQDFGWESEVADNPDNLQVALPHGIEEWSAAGKTTWGSVLRAFTFDYTKERVRQDINSSRPDLIVQVSAGPGPALTCGSPEAFRV